MWETAYHAIEVLLQQGKGELLLLCRNDQRSQQLSKLAQRMGVECRQVSPQKMQQHSRLQASFALLYQQKTEPRSLAELEVQPKSLFILLDGITDVGNFGAILRTSHRFAVDAVIVPPRRSVSQEQAQLARSSAGAAFHCPIVQSNLAQAIRHLREQGVWIYSTAMDGHDLYKWQPNWPLALILGAEDKGVSQLLQQQADQSLSITYPGSPDSLNVSVAAGICLYEACRHR